MLIIDNSLKFHFQHTGRSLRRFNRVSRVQGISYLIGISTIDSLLQKIIGKSNYLPFLGSCINH